MFNFSEGEIILIDKELGWSSFDVIKYIRPAIFDFEKKRTGIKQNIKIGHAGTLDPLASGLLLICTGKKTKEIGQLQLLRKTYTGAFYIGATTPSFDTETEVDQIYETRHIDEDMIISTAKKFIGKQEQVPPLYSAVNINGVRAYQLARQQVEVSLSAKMIEIYRFDIRKIEWPLVYFEIECSKGTYIRSIARDFGKALQSGAYLYTLRRERIGEYDVKDAMQAKAFINILHT